MRPINVCIWLDDQAEQAANFYVSAFDDARITNVQRYRGERSPDVAGKPEGSVLTVDIEIGDRQLTLLNGGPEFTLSEAMSLVIPCESQEEIDQLWSRLGEGGHTQPCGWLKDRFGVSWQVVPDNLSQLLSDDDSSRAGRVMDALMQMGKIDIAELQAAYDNKTVAHH